MAFQSFWQVIAEVKKYQKTRLCVAAAAEDGVLKAVREAMKEEMVDLVLVGCEETIWRIAVTISLNLKGMEIIDVKDPVEAAFRAVEEVSRGRADFLMKGMVNSTDFLKAVLSPRAGLRTEKLLSHLAAHEIPGYSKILYVTDGGLNIAPSLEQKMMILQNSVDFLQSIGNRLPKVAILSANERVIPNMPVTVEAEQMKARAAQGEIKGAQVEGPISLDAAISLEAAARKKIKSPVAGQADLLVVPNIESGNFLGKAIMCFAGGKMAGLVLGAKKPVILTSRNETPYGKVASIALAALSVCANRPQ